MSIIVIGIDLAKNIFAVHGINESGKAELDSAVTRCAKVGFFHKARRSE